MRAERDWDIVIGPRAPLWRLGLGEVWRYRDLLAMYVRRDIVTVYKQTILGPLWFLIQPLLTTLMFMLVFGGIAGISTDGLPQPLFYMAGLLCWNYFADCLNRCSDTFNANQAVFGKVYFPRLVVPLSVTLSNLLKLAIQLLLFLAVYAFFALRGSGVRPTAALLLLPALVLMLAGMGLGTGLLITSLTTKYRDLRFLVQFGVQLWMYATPVIYPLSVMESGRGRAFLFLARANPLTSVIEAFKRGALGAGDLSWPWLAYSAAFTLAALAAGTVMFNRVQRSFMDVI